MLYQAAMTLWTFLLLATRLGGTSPPIANEAVFERHISTSSKDDVQFFQEQQQVSSIPPASPDCWLVAFTSLKNTLPFVASTPRADSSAACNWMAPAHQKILALELSRCHLRDVGRPLMMTWNANLKASPPQNPLYCSADNVTNCLTNLTDIGVTAYTQFFAYVNQLCGRLLQETIADHYYSTSFQLAKTSEQAQGRLQDMMDRQEELWNTWMKQEAIRKQQTRDEYKELLLEAVKNHTPRQPWYDGLHSLVSNAIVAYAWFQRALTLVPALLLITLMTFPRRLRWMRLYMLAISMLETGMEIYLQQAENDGWLPLSAQELTIRMQYTFGSIQALLYLCGVFTSLCCSVHESTSTGSYGPHATTMNATSMRQANKHNYRKSWAFGRQQQDSATPQNETQRVSNNTVSWTRIAPQHELPRTQNPNWMPDPVSAAAINCPPLLPPTESLPMLNQHDCIPFPAGRTVGTDHRDPNHIDNSSPPFCVASQSSPWMVPPPIRFSNHAIYNNQVALQNQQPFGIVSPTMPPSVPATAGGLQRSVDTLFASSTAAATAGLVSGQDKFAAEISSSKSEDEDESSEEEEEEEEDDDDESAENEALASNSCGQKRSLGEDGDAENTSDTKRRKTTPQPIA